MSDVPEYEVVVERHNRRSTVTSIADGPHEALLDAVRAYTDIDTHRVGGVEIRHNDSFYSVVGFVEGRDDEDTDLSVNEIEQKGIFRSGGIRVTVSR